MPLSDARLSDARRNLLFVSGRALLVLGIIAFCFLEFLVPQLKFTLSVAARAVCVESGLLLTLAAIVLMGFGKHWLRFPLMFLGVVELCFWASGLSWLAQTA